MSISGLRVVAEFVTPAEEKELIGQIDEGEWITELKRRVQHYGYRYFYGPRRLEPSPTLPLPGWATGILAKLRDIRLASQSFDQLIVNEYLPGQGIAPHIDNPSWFGNEIVSLSLGSPCVMTFSQVASARKEELLLRPRDLLLIREEARYCWRHEIAARKTDRWEGRVVARQRRLSITFRKMVQ